MREREREREREKRKGMERRASTSSQPSAPRVLESGSDFGGGGYAAQKKGPHDYTDVYCDNLIRSGVVPTGTQSGTQF